MVLGGVIALFNVEPSEAAELTDVVDAMDDANDDPFDVHIEPQFRQEIQSGTIVREANCTPDPNGPPSAYANRTSCVDEAAIVFNRELDYERVISALDIDFQIGIYQDLEFHFTIPIIFSDTRTLTFSAGDGTDEVTQVNSGIDPADSFIQADLDDGGAFSTYRYFSVADVGAGPTRSGLGDMSFGLAWSPFNSERSSHVATLTLAFDYSAPTAGVARGGNTGVGRGVHEFSFLLAAARRFGIVEPYLGIGYMVPVLTSDSLFSDYGGGQITQGPGQQAEISAGAEFIMYENSERGQYFTFDVGFDFGFQAEGRDYSPVFDALAASGCAGTTPADANFPTDGRLYEPGAGTDPQSAACAWILQQPSSQVRDPGVPAENIQFVHDGITTVEGFATIGAHFALNFEVSEYVEVRLRTTLETETEHFLTATRTGRDRDGDDEVDFNDPNERNPVYNPTLDGVGRRLRAQSVFNFGWNATLAFQF